MAISQETGERFSDPYLHRLRGEVLFRRDPANPAPAEEAFQTAIAVAKEQGARSYQLLAALSLAKLYQSTGRPLDAHAVLAPALEGFSPTPEMPEIAEAQALLAALAETEEVKAEIEQRRRRLDLQTAYSQAMMWSKGFAAEETRTAFARAGELAARADDAPGRFVVHYARCVRSLMRGEYDQAREIAETFLREAEAEGRATEAGAARRMLGLALLNQGDLKAARSVLERAMYDSAPEGDEETQFVFDWDTDGEASAAAYLALAEWRLGEVERARQLIQRATHRAEKMGHDATIANTLFFKTMLENRRNDVSTTRHAADALLALAEEHGIKTFADIARVYANWARGRVADPEVGAVRLRQALAAAIAQGDKGGAPWLHGMLAELEAATRGPDSALTLIDQGLAIADEIGQRVTEPHLHRLRGDILLRRDPADPTAAEQAYRTAIAIAKEQGARSYELLASLSLAKLYQSTGRAAEAHAALAPALEGFSPTPEMPEIAEARALLVALQDIDEVKIAEAQRQRRTRLHVAYGNALIAARGYGAPETIEAFSRAREFVAGDEDAPERLAADYGLWVGSYTHGELSPMKAYAAAFLRDVEARPHSPEAGVAHRAVGITHWFAGEHREALEHLERALASFQPGRDDDLAFRFGNDAGAAAMLYLALTLWPLGDVERAASLVRSAQARIAGLAHTETRAHGKFHAAMFELMRGDLLRAASNAAELDALTREHELPLWRARGIFLDGLSTAQSGALSGGLEIMRRGVELVREQNVFTFDGLVKIALAEAEARAGDVDRAIAVLGEALATCERTGHRTFEAELHRARGEILLMRDPANPALAEGALQTAIAIAKRQAARSFELRVALALAKLYQSTGRLVEAHAVLAPALEDFSSTPEMPEIAEAQALMESLA